MSYLGQYLNIIPYLCPKKHARNFKLNSQRRCTIQFMNIKLFLLYSLRISNRIKHNVSRCKAIQKNEKHKNPCYNSIYNFCTVSCLGEVVTAKIWVQNVPPLLWTKSVCFFNILTINSPGREYNSFRLCRTWCTAGNGYYL